MEYETNTEWMKDLNTCGSIDGYVTYESPYSDDPSANSIQGKNLTLGNLPISFKPRNLTPVSAASGVGAYKLDRWSLMFENPNVNPGCQSCNTYEYNGVGPNAAQRVANWNNNAVETPAAESQSADTESKENYEIRGLRGSNIICEAYGPHNRRCRNRGWMIGKIIITLIFVIIALAVVITCWKRPITTTGGFKNRFNRVFRGLGI